MAGVNQTSRILTQAEFEKSPLKSVMSYQKYFDMALKFGSAFTFSRAYSLKNAQETTENIEGEVKGFYLEREAKKSEAEEKYYAALEQYEAMKTAQESALKRLQYTTKMFGEDSSWYSDALRKYDLSSKTLFGANINLDCARDQFNFANGAAFKAFLTTQQFT